MHHYNASVAEYITLLTKRTKIIGIIITIIIVIGRFLSFKK